MVHRVEIFREDRGIVRDSAIPDFMNHQREKIECVNYALFYKSGHIRVSIYICTALIKAYI